MRRIYFHRQHRIISRKRKAITNSKKNCKVYHNLIAKANFIEPSENFRQDAKENGKRVARVGGESYRIGVVSALIISGIFYPVMPQSGNACFNSSIYASLILFFSKFKYVKLFKFFNGFRSLIRFKYKSKSVKLVISFNGLISLI